MISRFVKNQPALYYTIKQAHWSYLEHFGSEYYLYRDLDFGIRIKLITKDDSVSKKIYLGYYEKETVSFLKKIILTGDVFYDIGANIGYYSLLFSVLAGPTGRIHAFEPSVREFSFLTENVHINRLVNVYLNQLAVADVCGIMEISVLENPAYGAYNTLGIPTHEDIANLPFRKETIRSITLDDYYSLYNARMPSIVKVDVEGAELCVLKGGKKLLSRDDSPLLVLEICPSTLMGLGVEPGQIIELVKDYGYHLYSIQPNGYLIPFKEEISLNLVAVKDAFSSRLSFLHGHASAM